VIEKKFPDNITQIRDNIDAIKSRIGSLSTLVEHKIEIILADYFTENDKDYFLFCELFYPLEIELTFGKKTKLLEKFLKKINPEYLRKNSDFINSLVRIRKLRNNFAHSINPTNEELRKIVGKSYFELKYIENGVPKTKNFPIKDIDDRFNDCKLAIDELKGLFKEMRKTKGARKKRKEKKLD